MAEENMNATGNEDEDIGVIVDDGNDDQEDGSEAEA